MCCKYRRGRAAYPWGAKHGTYAVRVPASAVPWHPRLHHIAKPKAFGANWAYIFPLAALASAAIEQADARGSRGARVLAWAAVSLQCVVGCLVVVKMILHQRRVMQGLEVWVDPLGA